MPLDFPNAPTVNQLYSGPSGVVWSWDGTKWVNGTGVAVYAPTNSPVFTGDPQAPTPPVGDADTSVATTAFVAAATATANHNTGRNLIHNPLFNVAQRGAGPWTANGYTVDRWQLYANLDTVNVSQVALSAGNWGQLGDEAALFGLYNSFTGNAGAAAQSLVYQPIEKVNRLSGKTVIVSFWAIAGSATTKLGVNYDQNFGTGGSPSATVLGAGQSVTLNTTWTRYSVTFTIPSVSGKTLGTNGDDRTDLLFYYSSGATNNAAAGGIGVQSGAVNLWGVQLEIGSVATPLEKPDPQQDLAKCQRFFQTGAIQLSAYQTAGAPFGAIHTWVTTMRAAATVVFNGQTYTNASGLTADFTNGSFLTWHAAATAVGAVLASSAFTASADL